MSDSRRHIAALTALGAMILGASALSAQSHAVSRDSMLRTIRALDSVVIDRSRSVDSVRRALVRPVPPITVRRGALEVRTVAALESRVRTAVDSVASLIDRRGGPALSARVTGHVPMILPDSTREVFGDAARSHHRAGHESPIRGGDASIDSRGGCRPVRSRMASRRPSSSLRCRVSTRRWQRG